MAVPNLVSHLVFLIFLGGLSPFCAVSSGFESQSGQSYDRMNTVVKQTNEYTYNEELYSRYKSWYLYKVRSLTD